MVPSEYILPRTKFQTVISNGVGLGEAILLHIFNLEAFSLASDSAIYGPYCFPWKYLLEIRFLVKIFLAGTSFLTVIIRGTQGKHIF
jgi:hypothetical protein